MRAIGLMSGTSLDGIDVALVETDGETAAPGPAATYPYAEAERALLVRALDAARTLADRAARPGLLAEAEAMLTARHEAAVRDFCAAHGYALDRIDVVGFHGQTVLHRPERRLTIQLGDGARLARALAIPVVHDFRAADVAAGGQGAPLVPVFHRALVRALGGTGPVAVLNIGGVANISYIDGETLIACDTGPGNALLDDFMARRTGKPLDRDGACAARGRADKDWLARALAQPFFEGAPPKSLDRDDFAALSVEAMTTEDGAATLAAFTARGVARVVPLLPRAPVRWIVVGGGAHNPVLMELLAEALAPAPVVTGASLGWNGDAIEAQAFAFLAVRSLRGLPLTYPATTGVPAPLCGGVLARP
ncbi:MAG: anhydro-N-acetylmuramic acid kinase [Xanthobacteraceae bacterium]|nr:MAG: anhydro-N-acetylmuramic acid kinase [Xanthobacteraceae bacterium]